MKRNDSPVKNILYIFAVLILIAFIGFLWMTNRSQRSVYQEQQEKMAEQEALMTEAMTESESEQPETAAPARQNTGKSSAGSQKQTETETESENETEEPESESSAVNADRASLRLMVVNGSGRQGVAGEWQTYLGEQGYADIQVGSSSQEPQDDTVVYCDDAQSGAELAGYFQSAVVRTQSVTAEEISLTSADLDPLEFDAVIVIGRNYERAD